MSITLDGTCYWIRSGALHRLSTSKKGTISTWVTVGDNDDTQMYLLQLGGSGGLGTDPLALYRSSTNKFVLKGLNSIDSQILNISTDTEYTSSSTWLHLLFAWDLSAGAGYVYVNRSDDTASGATLTDATLDWVEGPVGFMSGYAGGNAYVGSVHDFLFWPGFYLDPTDGDELRKVISSDGQTDYGNPGPTAGTPKPVGYGAGGALVTGGTRASMIFSGPFTDNRGTGGTFSQTGSFSWVDPEDDVDTYRQSGAPNARDGERSFDSERTGWTYARHNTFVEQREGLSDFGKRLGIPERAERTRDERPGSERNFTRLIYGDEEDTEDRR